MKKKEPTQPNTTGTANNKNKAKSNKVFGRPAVPKLKNRKEKPRFAAPQKRKVVEDDPDADEEEDEEETTAQDMMEMLDDEGKAEFSGKPAKGKKRKLIDEEAENEDRSAKHFEKEYAAITQAEDSGKKRTVSLLPIKTKDGEVIKRSHEVDYEEEDDEEEQSDEEEEEQVVDSDDDVVRNEMVSTYNILWTRFIEFKMFFFWYSIHLILLMPRRKQFPQPIC